MTRSLSKGRWIGEDGFLEAVAFSGDTGSWKVTRVSESTGPLDLRGLYGSFALLCLEALKNLGVFRGFAALGALASLGRVECCG